MLLCRPALPPFLPDSLVQLNYVCERPELNGDTQWAETGDRCAPGSRAARQRMGCCQPRLRAAQAGLQSGAPPTRPPTITPPCPPCAALPPGRYLLKLFRDLLFHQVDEEGAPLLDWGLAMEALNKVDAGVPEKVRCVWC